MQKNIPEVKIGVVAVSRNCFPIELSRTRSGALAAAYKKAGGELFLAKTIVEKETDVAPVLKELSDNGCNALVVYLGNFGPETPETILAQQFDGPIMFAAAAEENTETLKSDRGDAYCGMLNASYNLKLRKKRVYIPEYPVGTTDEIAAKIAEFEPIARIYLGLKGLKLVTFGSRPNDFLACNAPIKPLYDLGVEVEENSELDLYYSFNQHANDPRIPSVVEDMKKEIHPGKYDEVLTKLAQYEVTLLDWAENARGASKYLTFANKCWPIFQPAFGFVPCFVNSRFTSRLMPISCEVDVYGALTEYIIACATEIAPTLLDINNTVPSDIYDAEIKGKYDYTLNDTFMGFHCGNTPSCHLLNPEIKYQVIMRRTLEPGKEPYITRGTLEGDIKPGDITFFRLQSTADTQLKSYIAQGEVLPVATRSFGGIGIFAIPEMARFYRHVLVEKNFPHHGGVAFAKVGAVLYEAMKLIGIEDISFNQPKGMLYPTENPFAK